MFIFAIKVAGVVGLLCSGVNYGLSNRFVPLFSGFTQKSLMGFQNCICGNGFACEDVIYGGG